MEIRLAITYSLKEHHSDFWRTIWRTKGLSYIRTHMKDLLDDVPPGWKPKAVRLKKGMGCASCGDMGLTEEGNGCPNCQPGGPTS